MRHLPPTDSQSTRSNTPATPSALRRRAAAFALLSAPLLAGCEADSWFDPSVIGRWEHTPTVVPILDRIAAIEHDDAGFVETSDVTPEDLIPVAAEYRITTGDLLVIRIRDFVALRDEAEYERVVDRRGYIDIPRLPAIRVQGLSPVQARDAIAQAIRDAGILRDPTVSVVPAQQRQQTFSAMGAVQNPAQYFIPSPDYRLLQALTAAGGFSESATHIYVIRQVPLAEPAASGVPTGTSPSTPSASPSGPDSGQPPVDLNRLIDDLTKPPPDGGATPPPPPPPPQNPPPSPGVYSSGESLAMVGERVRWSQPANGSQPPADPPPIDLPDSPKPVQPMAAPAAATPAPGAAGSQWLFVNGQWVKAAPAAQQPQDGNGGSRADSAPDVLVTQRVIKVPTGPLIAGSAKYNIIVRPGDIIRVPSNLDQFFYVGGQISRPGVYTIPRAGITMLRALTASGGLTAIAIPERVDLTRMVGTNRQATIRLNLRAIAEQTQPDIYLKNDDLINIGTNFWAYPLAVIRNGIRASYGFGFVLDRNFGSDVFGVPPEAKARGF